MTRGAAYDTYIRSGKWQAKRQAALLAADYRCQLCNGTKRLDVHHRTYERFGDEAPGDLTVLCRKCHDKFHQSGRKVMPPKRAKAKARAAKKEAARQAALENDRLHRQQQQDKLKQKLVREGTVSTSLRADLAQRHRR